MEKMTFRGAANPENQLFCFRRIAENQLLAFWELQKINFLRFVRCKKSRALQHEDILKETVLKAR